LTLAGQYPQEGITMRIRSIKGLSVLAAAVAMSTSLGLAGATAASASPHTVKPAETTVCNNSSMKCTNISSLLLNQGNGPDYVQNATGLGVVAPSLYQGRKVNLRQASNSRTNEDFIVRFLGTLGQLCGTGGVNSIDPTSYACLNYPTTYPVYQGQFAPNSDESGFCVGAMSATLGFKVRLEPCGSPRTFWVADLAAGTTVTLPAPFQPLRYFPLEFAADTSASNPLVLTLNPNTKAPANELFIQQENLQGGSVPDRQMFTLTDPAGFTF
jgi:hypothetical protein